MSLLRPIKRWQIKSFTIGTCRVMLAGFLALKYHYEDQMKKEKIEAKLFSDLAAEALSTRPRWKMIGKNVFEHNSGGRIEIKKDDSLADVILSVILIEMREFIFNDSNSEEIFSIILNEFQKFFSLSNEDMEKLTKKNKEFLATFGEIQIAKLKQGGY